MSNLDLLMQKLCPNGVEYIQLRYLAEIGTGSSDRKDSSEEGQYPFYVRSREVLRISKYEYDEEAIVIPGEGGIGEIFHFVKGKYALHQRAYRIHLVESQLTTRFLYYYMVSRFKGFIMEKAVSATVTSIRKPMIEQFPVPVPPIEVQHEIVRILDNFTELTAELTTELEYRKKQYSAISTEHFEHAKELGKNYSLSDICNIEKGKTPIQKAVLGQYPLVVTTSERKTNDTYQFDCEAVCIPMVSSRGHGVASLNHVYYQKGKFALGNILCAVIPRDYKFVSTKYLYFYFEQTKDYSIVPLMKGGANVALHVSDLERIKVPIPSLEIQQTIVKQLELFEVFVNVELPAEIRTRQKQYEYYRDKLLSFAERDY